MKKLFLTVSTALIFISCASTPEKPVEPPKPVTVVITTKPAGAEIILAGNSTGILTPGKIELPPSETAVITLKKDGYWPHKISIIPKDGDSLSYDLQSQKKKK